jgi:hypothetical protein
LDDRLLLIFLEYWWSRKPINVADSPEKVNPPKGGGTKPTGLTGKLMVAGLPKEDLE